MLRETTYHLLVLVDYAQWNCAPHRSSLSFYQLMQFSPSLRTAGHMKRHISQVMGFENTAQ